MDNPNRSGHVFDSKPKETTMRRIYIGEPAGDGEFICDWCEDAGFLAEGIHMAAGQRIGNRVAAGRDAWICCGCADSIRCEGCKAIIPADEAIEGEMCRSCAIENDVMAPPEPGTPLWYVREEVQSLREMVDRGMVAFTAANIAVCLDHILREIDRQAVRGR